MVPSNCGRRKSKRLLAVNYGAYDEYRSEVPAPNLQFPDSPNDTDPGNSGSGNFAAPSIVGLIIDLKVTAEDRGSNIKSGVSAEPGVMEVGRNGYLYPVGCSSPRESSHPQTRIGWI